MAGWDDIRKIALSLPEARKSPGERAAFRVRGKLFAWRSRDRDGGTLALRVDRDEKPMMLEARPDLYFQTPHYEGVPGRARPPRRDRPRRAPRADRGRVAHPGTEALANDYLAGKSPSR